MNLRCRHCDNKLNFPILDLGNQPPSNAYLTNEQLYLPEITYPLRLYLCDNCWLPQIPELAKANELLVLYLELFRWYMLISSEGGTKTYNPVITCSRTTSSDHLKLASNPS